MKKNFILSLFILFISAITYSQVQFEWDHMLSNGTSGIAVNVDSPGNSYVVYRVFNTNTPDRTIIQKYSPGGSIIFSILSDSACYPRSVFMDSSFNQYIVGDYRGGWGANANFTIMKYSSAGNLLWRNIDTSSQYNYSVAIDGDKAGNVSYLRKQGVGGKILSYNPQGIIQNIIVITDTLIPVSLKVDNMNNKILLGYTGLGYEVTSVLIKYSQAGIKMWRKDFTFPLDSSGSNPGSLQISASNNIYIFTSVKMQVSNRDYALFKYNSSGILQWTSYFDYNYSNNTAGTFVIDEHENIYVSGNLGTVKYDSSGAKIWASITENTGALALDNFHNVYLSGVDSVNYYNHIKTIKIDTAGSLAWSIIYANSGNGEHFPGHIVTDDAGNIFLTGLMFFNPISQGNGGIIKYSQLVGIEKITGDFPANFYLSQNYPNPFNPSTNIQLQIPKTSLTELLIYDLTGRKVATLVNKVLERGIYNIVFNGNNLGSGIYLYQLNAGNYSYTKKMVLLK